MTPSLATLHDLEARIASATGPDRELDARIWAAFNNREFRVDEKGRFIAKSLRAPFDECVIDGVFWLKSPSFRSLTSTTDVIRSDPADKYPSDEYLTSSLDAACAFRECVLQTWRESLTRMEGERWYAEVGVSSSYHRTRPLALMHATIRALIAKAEEEQADG